MSERIEIAAYYFPNYHRDARNDRWYGQGWTEWNLLRAAQPRYPGHQQPKVPAWGYFDESDPAWAEREIDLAADHGVTSFLYDWYWYEDGPYLQDALERGFLAASNRQRLRFALMWANHDWINLHPALYSNFQQTLAPGIVSPSTFDRLVDHVVENYFSQPNYLTIEGCPYFSIYELGRFIKGFDGLSKTAAAVNRFRDRVRSAGFRDLHLNGVVWGFEVLPGELKLANPSEVAAALGLASVTSYAWVHHYDLSAGSFPRGDYAAAAQANFQAWEKYRRMFSIPYSPNVSMGWDPSPRTVQTSPYGNRGYPWTAVLDGNTPEAFAAALRQSRRFVESQPETTPRMITLNAWNEWTEGSYLLPDAIHGTEYLEQIRDVFGKIP